MKAGIAYGVLSKSGNFYLLDDQKLNRGSWDSFKDIIKPLVDDIITNDINSQEIIPGVETSEEDTESAESSFDISEDLGLE
jgi:hypothetical protein